MTWNHLVSLTFSKVPRLILAYFCLGTNCNLRTVRADFLSWQKLVAAILLEKKSIVRVLASNILMRISIVKIVGECFLPFQKSRLNYSNYEGYRSERLKNRLQKYFQDKLIVHQTKAANEPDLIYYSQVNLQTAINKLAYLKKEAKLND